MKDDRSSRSEATESVDDRDGDSKKDVSGDDSPGSEDADQGGEYDDDSYSGEDDFEDDFENDSDPNPQPEPTTNRDREKSPSAASSATKDTNAGGTAGDEDDWLAAAGADDDDEDDDENDDASQSFRSPIQRPSSATSNRSDGGSPSTRELHSALSKVTDAINRSTIENPVSSAIITQLLRCPRAEFASRMESVVLSWRSALASHFNASSKMRETRQRTPSLLPRVFFVHRA